jgi:hypothetical protein
MLNPAAPGPHRDLAVLLISRAAFNMARALCTQAGLSSHRRTARVPSVGVEGAQPPGNLSDFEQKNHAAKETLKHIHALIDLIYLDY